MGYIREPKNVDLVVGPSVFTEETRKKITQAIAQYKKTGEKPNSVDFITQGSVKKVTHIRRANSNTTQPNTVERRRVKL